ncbi:MAG: dihydropyrimidinase [Chloroflexota bacterium]|nr:dihydropyrimidinase [Chloroflexota bacterium]
MTTLIKNGTVVTSGGTYSADVLIEGEKIAAIGQSLEAGDAEIIDARGKHVLPGGIDVHTHLDMPFGGTMSSDDFASGQVAAAFGGTTTHLDFVIQPRGASLAQALDLWHGKARDKAAIDYGFHVAITDLTESILDEIATLPEHGVSSIKLFLAYKGTLQVDDTTLFRALGRARDAGVMTMVHAENGDAIEVLVREAVAAGNLAPIHHALTRPPQLEGEATGRAIAMAEVQDAPLYIVHLTCEDALVRVQEARQRGAPVWAETCTQYLFFTKDDLDREGFEGAKYVCSPPFREGKDQELLWAALRDDDLSVVSTDHCPFYYSSQKTLGRDDFSQIPNGIPGIEDRMMVLHEAGVNGGRFDLERFVALTATNPAKLFGLAGRKGSIAPGFDADLAIWDMNVERTIGLTNHSAVDYNLYEGMTVHGVPETVLVRGRVIVDGDRFLGRSGYGQYLRRERVGGAARQVLTVGSPGS